MSDYLKIVALLLFSLLVLGIIISIPFVLFWLLRKVSKNSMMKMANRLPLELKKQLSNPASFREASKDERKQYARRNMRKGLLVYLIFVSMTIIEVVLIFVEHAWEMLKVYFIVSLVILAFIMIFVLKDYLLVSSRTKIYRMKAYMFPSPSIRLEKQHWVYYYDIKQYIYEVENIAIPRYKNKPIQGIVEVLAIEEKKKLRVFSIYIPDETSIV